MSPRARAEGLEQLSGSAPCASPREAPLRSVVGLDKVACHGRPSVTGFHQLWMLKRRRHGLPQVGDGDSRIQPGQNKIEHVLLLSSAGDRESVIPSDEPT